MLKLSILILAVAISAVSAFGKTPVLLELFTSEGCSDCPPADHLLATLDEKQPEAGADVIVLSEHVDYFNYLGWKDPFSAALFTERQESYSRRPHFDGVYTPQLVVDGRFGFVGSDGGAASAAIRKAARKPKIPVSISDVTRGKNELTVRVETAENGDLRTARGNLYVAIAEERAESRVARGENGGRVLRHVAVVRTLKSAGAMSAAKSKTELTIPLQPEWGAGGLRVVAFIQDPASGYIFGVGQRKITH